MYTRAFANVSFLHHILCTSYAFYLLQVTKLTTLAKDRLELGRALVRASDKATAKAKPKAKAAATPATPAKGKA